MGVFEKKLPHEPKFFFGKLIDQLSELWTYKILDKNFKFTV